jgi:F0F1-type ATP synthase assembly protein I
MRRPKENYKKIIEVSSLALMLPSSIVVGLFFGYMLDKWLKTNPWMMLLFFFLGTASGLISLLRGINKYKDF